VAVDPFDQGRVEALAAPRPSSFLHVYGRFVTVLEAWCVLQMVAMALIVLLGVWYRYVVQRALPWYDEFAEFLLVWLTFYGSVLAAHRGAHIGFEALLDYLPPVVRRAALVLSDIIVLVIQAALVIYGWKLVQAASFDTAISIRAVRLSWIYAAIPISAGLIFLLNLPRVVLRIMGRAVAA